MFGYHRKVDQRMKALALAKQFRDFVNRTWPGDYDPEPDDLLSFFVDWAQEPETQFVWQTRGDHGLLMVTWALVSAWFVQRPEDFPTIREFVTVPAKLNFDTLDHLPFPFDKALWDGWVFERLHGRI